MKFTDVIAASIAAYKASQNEIITSDGLCYPPGTTAPFYRWSNKTLVLFHLKHRFPDAFKREFKFEKDKKPFDLLVTDETRREAERLIGVVSSSYMMALLSNQRVSNFTAELSKTVEARETMDINAMLSKVGMLVYLPQVAAAFEKQNNRQEKEQDFVVSRHLGKIRDKLEINVTVFNCIYSTNWNRYFVKAYTDNNDVVFFSSDRAWENSKKYNVRARIKKLVMNEQPGRPTYKITGLSHVKELS